MTFVELYDLERRLWGLGHDETGRPRDGVVGEWIEAEWSEAYDARNLEWDRLSRLLKPPFITDLLIAGGGA